MARLSPWVFVGIGCLGVTALGILAIGGVGLMVTNTMKEELARPIDKQALLKALEGVPVHPKAVFDEQLTRGARSGSVMATKFIKLEMTVAAFRLDAPEQEVRDWYKKTMPEHGYQQEDAGNPEQLKFVKKTDQVLIASGKSWLNIIRVKLPGTN
ncbi:hypothetical protein [Armatimonas sp.]|uniref:hypothetical protein n=1 Tax=Armatimonas sp. TaxID=1872638 RepID=UPI00374D90AC